MVPDPAPPGDSTFDAIGAAKELDDLLGDATDSASSGAEDGEYVARLESDIEELNALIAKKDVELARANERADQAHAEIEAASTRIGNASGKELEQRTRKLLESFLPVVDDIDRAIAAAKNHAEHADVVTGMELVRRSLLAKLGTFGVAHVPALGETFDPRRHEAIALVPVTDPAQDGRVIDVMREGYAIGEDTLRPAGVAVGKRAG
ncbi:MAG: nucleotide exchange factor GrpE [Deltaproteobacteria bacterium]|nr:nucleotide exchange factor GrpE [Deltaproteobacteria bacterium]